jgi:hypothetical protein
METQLTGRFRVRTDPAAVSDDQLVGELLLYDEFDNVINPMNKNGGVNAVVVLTQAEYNALAEKDSNTLYIIQG